jgi:DinB superfamily
MMDSRVPNFKQCLHVLRQTPAVLRSLTARASREQLDWRPSTERWSITMVLAHLADAEIGGFRNRFEAMLGEENPWLASYSQSGLFQAGTQFDPFAEMAHFEEERGRTLAVLGNLPEGAGERGGRHEEFGDITIAQLINEFAFHDLGHTRQVIELYRSHVFYPEMGAYQSYYRINP